jgi:multidrug efflux pump subunit AcrA (membrane-fusion protein)
MIRIFPAVPIVFALTLLAAGGAGCGRGAAQRSEPVWHEVRQGPIESWLPLEGRLKPRRVEAVVAPLPGSAALMELAEDGRTVSEGEILARFDTATVEQDLRRATLEWETARADLDMLEKATLPLEARDLDEQVEAARAECEAETQFLRECRTMLEDRLISAAEVRQQEEKTAAAEERLTQMVMRKTLTIQHLHAGRLERARAAESAARIRMREGSNLVERAVVRAPRAGMVSLVPVQIAHEFRLARVGDTLYRNQPFMNLPALDEWVAEFLIPESDLGRVCAQARAEMSLLPWPEFPLTGAVESVGGTAETVSHREAERFFRMRVRIDQKDSRLRTGLSVRARILSGRREQATLLPRLALDYRNGRAGVNILRGGRAVWTPVTPGLTDLQTIEALGGVQPGDRVLLP